MERVAVLRDACWVVAPPEFAAPVLRRVFRMQGSVAGKISLSALGFFTVFVNGQRVGKEYFLPSSSLWRERDPARLLYPLCDRFTYRAYVTEYDITPYLCEGENLLEIALGNGWYRQTERIAEGDMAFGDALGAIYALTLTDCTGTTILHSDGTEDCHTGATVESQLFIGETYDARIARDASYRYAPVKILALSGTVLSPDDSVPDRIVRTLAPHLLLTDGARRLYDAGENISGFVTLLCHAAEGETVTVRFAENLRDGQLDFTSCGVDHVGRSGKAQIMEDTYIGDGEEHRFTPMFVWHAFRYFEVIGDAVPLSVDVVCSDTPPRATFCSGSEALNWLFDAALRTQRNNMHSGVPSDCPHRERLGYTGDGQIFSPSAMLLLDCQPFYRKWIRDIFDSQNTENGHINHTAPFGGGGGGPGGWGCAAILVPYHYYKIYGDTEPLRTHYDGMCRYIAYLRTRMENGLVVREEAGGWCLGDWCTPQKTVIPPPLVNTAYLLRSLACLTEIAAVLGREADIPGFLSLREMARNGMTDAYYRPESGSFADGVQGADAFALWCGLGDSRTKEALLTHYRALGRFDTGFLATDILCELLSDWGEADLLYTLLTAEGVGSFSHMRAQGATTVWERWNGGSHDHPMFGACVRQLFHTFLGIRQEKDSVGYARIIVAPQIPAGLAYADGSLTLSVGTLSVAWEKADDTVSFTVTVPRGLPCAFHYGGDTVLLDAGTHTIIK